MIFTWCRKQKSNFISYKKLTRKKAQKRVGKMNGEVIIMAHCLLSNREGLGTSVNYGINNY